MQIILLERIGGLGQMGDVVKVRDGYARNFLLPKGKALRATKVNLARFETDRAQLEVRNLELKKEAEAVAVKLNGKRFVALRQASDVRPPLWLRDHARHRRNRHRRRLHSVAHADPARAAD